MARRKVLTEIPRETLRTGVIHLMQLAYAYEARDPSATQDAHAYKVLHDAIVAAAEQRDDLVARHREAMAAKHLPTLAQLVSATRKEGEPAKRLAAQQQIERLLVNLIGIADKKAQRAAQLAVEKQWINANGGPVEATKAILADSLACSTRHIDNLRRGRVPITYSPFRPYPVQDDDAKQTAASVGRPAGSVVIRASAKSLLRYVFDLVDWPPTPHERDLLASKLDAERRFSQPGYPLKGLLPFVTPAMDGKQLKSRKPRRSGGKANAKRLHEEASTYVGKKASGKSRKESPADGSPASKRRARDSRR